MVVCLERGADLHIAQLMSLPLTVSCFSKIQIGFTFLVPAHPGNPGQRAVKRVCVVCVIHSDYSRTVGLRYIVQELAIYALYTLFFLIAGIIAAVVASREWYGLSRYEASSGAAAVSLLYCLIRHLLIASFYIDHF